jgi:hypothetical protein
VLLINGTGADGDFEGCAGRLCRARRVLKSGTAPEIDELWERVGREDTGVSRGPRSAGRGQVDDRTGDVCHGKVGGEERMQSLSGRGQQDGLEEGKGRDR